VKRDDLFKRNHAAIAAAFTLRTATSRLDASSRTGHPWPLASIRDSESRERAREDRYRVQRSRTTTGSMRDSGRFGSDRFGSDR
jgi:hypothetical protein